MINNVNWGGVKPRLLGIFLGMGYGLDGIMPVCAPSWFLVSLFIIHLIACIVVKKKRLVWMVCGGAILANVIIHYLGLKVISPISFIMGLPFFCIGFMLKGKLILDFGHHNQCKKESLRRVVLIGLLLAATVMLSLYNGRVECCKVDYGRSIAVFYVNALIGIGLISLLSRAIGPVFTSFVTVICQGTIFVLGFHIFIIRYLLMVIQKTIPSFVYYHWIGPVIALAYLLVSYPIIKIFFLYFPELLGYKRTKGKYR